MTNTAATNTHRFASLLDQIRTRAQNGGLAQGAYVEAIPAGECIIRQGEVGDCFYLIVSGEVSVSMEEVDDAEVARLRNGEVFGEMAVVAREPRAATVTSTQPCELVRINADCARTMLEANPNAREYLGKISVRRTERNLRVMIDGPDFAGGTVA